MIREFVEMSILHHTAATLQISLVKIRSKGMTPSSCFI